MQRKCLSVAGLAEAGRARINNRTRESQNSVSFRPQLSQYLVHGDTGTGRKVQRSKARLRVGDAQAVLRPDGSVYFFGNSVTLVAKKKEIAMPISDIPEGAGCSRREEPRACRSGSPLKVLPIRMFVQVQRFPVIHSAAPQMAVGNSKTEGMD